jgi:hypothetical protein
VPTRYIAFSFGPTSVDPEKLRQHPGVEIYTVDASAGDIEEQTDMALLADLHCPVEIVFIGGGKEARTLAERYYVAWTDDGEDVNEVVLRLWGLIA